MPSAKLAAALAPLAVLMLAPSGAAAEEAEANLLAFNGHCRQCHVLNEGDHRLGPSLYGIFGAEAGKQEGFGYSSAMQASRVVWDERSLDRFMADPDAVVPGHNMRPFPGVASAEARARIVAHLQAEAQAGD